MSTGFALECGGSNQIERQSNPSLPATGSFSAAAEKELSTLYELWCFVALANILRCELKLTPRPPAWLRVEQRRVTLELVKGRTSVLEMERDSGELLRVVYNRFDNTPTGVVFGMTIATAIGFFLIPLCYVFVMQIIERGGKKAPAPAPAVVPVPAPAVEIPAH